MTLLVVFPLFHLLSLILFYYLLQYSPLFYSKLWGYHLDILVYQTFALYCHEYFNLDTGACFLNLCDRVQAVCIQLLLEWLHSSWQSWHFNCSQWWHHPSLREEGCLCNPCICRWLCSLLCSPSPEFRIILSVTTPQDVLPATWQFLFEFAINKNLSSCTPAL